MSDDRRYDGDFREVTEDFNEPEEIEIIMESGDEAAGGSSADEQADGSGDSPEEKEKDAPDEKYCVICHRSSRKAGKLVDIPGGMCVCTDCLQKGFDTMQHSGINLNESFGIFPPFITSDNIDMDMLGTMHQPKKKKKTKPVKKLTLEDLPAPHMIKAKLDEYVIGQDRAKKIMAVGVYNHYKRILSEPAKDDDVEIEKSNMLMIGPTGSGKTYLVKTLARLLDVPLAMTDATSLTEAGYIGDDIESVVSKLLAAADNDVERAEHGIIFIDEIDKIAKKKNTNQRDVSGEAVQQGMLKLLEGSEVEVPVGATNKNAMVPLETVNTKNILFICGGAFPDLENVIKERLTKTSTMGFQSELKDRFDGDKDILQQVRMEDLRQFGMIPEFLGRLPIVFALESLTEDMLVEILREPKNAILKQYRKLMEIDEVKLTFEDEALHAIAAKALERETGARALRAIIEDFMLDIMYEVPKDKNIGEVIVTRALVEHKGAPKIIFRGQEYDLGS